MLPDLDADNYFCLLSEVNSDSISRNFLGAEILLYYCRGILRSINFKLYLGNLPENFVTYDCLDDGY